MNNEEINYTQLDGTFMLFDVNNFEKIKSKIKRLEEESNKYEEDIINKYKEDIGKIYENKDDNEYAHGLRDELYNKILVELGYKELANLLIQVEKDIGFWYS